MVLQTVNTPPAKHVSRSWCSKFQLNRTVDHIEIPFGDRWARLIVVHNRAPHLQGTSVRPKKYGFVAHVLTVHIIVNILCAIACAWASEQTGQFIETLSSRQKFHYPVLDLVTVPYFATKILIGCKVNRYMPRGFGVKTSFQECYPKYNLVNYTKFSIRGSASPHLTLFTCINVAIFFM